MDSSVVCTVLVTGVLCVQDCNQDGPSSFVGAVLVNRCAKRKLQLRWTEFCCLYSVGDRCAKGQLQLRWTEFYCLYSVLVTGVLGEDCSQEGETVTVCTMLLTLMGVLGEDCSRDGQNCIVRCCKTIDKMDVVLLLLSCLRQVCSV